MDAFGESRRLWFLLALADRPGSRVLGKCFPFLDLKKEFEYQNLSTFDQAVEDALASARYSPQERDILIRLRNEWLMKKKALLMLSQKPLSITAKKGGDTYTKGGFMDIKLYFA